MVLRLFESSRDAAAGLLLMLMLIWTKVIARVGTVTEDGLGSAMVMPTSLNWDVNRPLQARRAPELPELRGAQRV
jgi:hypothetical protein